MFPLAPQPPDLCHVREDLQNVYISGAEGAWEGTRMWFWSHLV